MSEKEIIDLLMVQNRHFAYALSTTQARLVLQNEAMWENGFNKFHLMSECLIPTAMSYQILKNSPIKDTINTFVQHLVEAGHFKQFQTMADHYLQIDKGVFLVTPEEVRKHKMENKMVAMRTSDFDEIFYFYSVGTAISVIAFLGEHAWHRFRTRKRSQTNITLN